MHRALKVNEIISLIVEHLDCDSSLTAAARTCRQFYLPSLRVLWESPTDIAFWELCYLLFPQARHEGLSSVHQSNSPFYTSDLVLDPLNLPRFRRHAALIRDLRLIMRPQRNAAILKRLMMIVSPQIVMPALRTLSIFADDPHNLYVTSSFLVPSLRRVFVDVRDEPDFLSDPISRAFQAPLCDFVFGLAGSCPLVTQLQLDTPLLFQTQEQQPIVDGLTRLNHLRYLSVRAHTLHQLLFEGLSQLEELEISIEEREFSSDQPLRLAPYNGIGLESLRKCCLSSPCNNAAEILTALPDSISNLSWSNADDALWSERDLSGLAALLSAKFKNLKVLSIQMEEEGYSNDGEENQLVFYPVSWRWFSPLLRCNRLVHFSFHVSTSRLQLEDADIDAMAHAWPYLEDLSITWTGPLAYRKKVTTDSLISLSRLCPCLLIIAITSLEPSFTRAMEPSPMAQHSGPLFLDTCFEDTEVENARETGRRLAQMWPMIELRCLTGMKGITQEWCCSCETVYDEVRRIQDISESPMSA